jgi:peptidoglycan/LPS O-acetylase OafA/YrhL
VQPSTNTLNDIRTYKPFIDGLRAIAITTVVASHVGLPVFSGGYVGVDVFFVISGYLIINQIVADIGNGRFGLLEFGARRAWRILPAFILVMMTCLVLVTTVFVQPEYKDFAQSFFFSTLMLVNHHYLAHQGYFDMAAFTKPLLHMWSLAVEEQFYLVAPLILLGLTAATARMIPGNVQRTWWMTTVGLAVLSFAACVAFTYPMGRSNISFYTMPTRGWQFILGGVAPSLVPLLRRWPSWVSSLLAMIGIAAIALAVVLFDGDTLYPSYRAALPTIGAMLIIAGGLAAPRNTIACALSAKPMIGIGLISYAWYLWHWPLISFVRTMNFGQRDIGKELASAVLSLALAALTYRFIEVPIRHWRRSHSTRPAVVAVVGPVSCLLVASIGYGWCLLVAPRLLPSIAGLEAVQTRRDYPQISHHGVLIGDSHAGILKESFQEYARRAGSQLTVTSRAGCPPLLRIAVNDYAGRPLTFCEPYFQKIAFGGDEFAIVVARWNFYLGLPPSDPFYRSSYLVAESGKRDPTNPYELMAQGLAATLAAAKSSDVRRLLIVAPLPEFPAHPPYCLMRAIRTTIDGCAVERATVDARRARTMEILRRATAGTEGVRVIDPIDVFCTESECRPHEGRTLYFRDTNHLSTAGAARFYKAYEKDFQWAMTGDESSYRPHEAPSGTNSAPPLRSR